MPRKIDYKEVKQYIEIESNSGCKLISEEYKNNRTKLNIQCKCGNLFKTDFDHFKNRKKMQCNNCGKQNGADKLKFTYDEVKYFVEIESNCRLLSDSYNDSRQKLDFTCECGNLFRTSFSEFKHMNKRQCNDCGEEKSRIGGTTLTYKQVKNYIEIESESGCKLLSEVYINNSTDLIIQCKCGNEFKRTFTKFKDSNRTQCTVCSNCKRRTHEEFCQEVNEITNGEYTVLGKFETTGKKILIRHNHKRCDNYEWEITPSDFLKGGYRCPKCAGNAKKTTEIYKRDVFNIVGDEYEVLGDYCNANTGILMRHNSDFCHNHEWICTPSSFINRRTRCPICALQRISGKNNYMWNPLLTQEDREENRDFPEYTEWVNAVYKRDNYTCNICGKRGNKLNAHHLNGYNWDKNNRLNINNGVTLCKDCHIKFHRLYKYGYNTKNQFEEFKIIYKDNESSNDLNIVN